MDGQALRHAREALGLTQVELGALLGVPQSTITRWERGVHRIEHPLMLALALDALAGRVWRAGDGERYGERD